MKKKELIELMNDTACELLRVNANSSSTVDGEKVEIHRLAHGAGMALVLAAYCAKEGEHPSPRNLAVGIVNATIDWELDHPELMGGKPAGEGGDDE